LRSEGALELETAPTPGDRVAFLAALGNAKVPEDATLVTRFAADSSAEVRQQVPWTLRAMPTPEAKDAILGLVGAESLLVRLSALHRLPDHALAPDDLEKLAGIVVSGKVRAEAVERLVGFLARFPRSEPVTRVLAHLSGRPDLSDALKAKIRDLDRAR
jgi:HEAT repeat protein